jgi:ubiquinone/menaquinone biosynthesis C-methylase UbiE
MQKLNIKLLNDPTVGREVQISRDKAIKKNINGSFGQSVIQQLLVSPDRYENYTLEKDQLISLNGKSVPIKKGIPDFTIFSSEALDEKARQAEYHDNEQINETFDEIVLRPFNYNRLHATIWLKHLYRMSEEFKKISRQSFKNLTILNCGCGGGFEAQFLAEQGAKVVGFDISQLRAEAAATRFAMHNLEGFFYRGDAAILPFKDNTFDIVLYHDSLHHVPIEEIPKAIKEARRVSKKYVILSEAHDSPLRMLLESLGFSISIEASGNYTFRFKKSLIDFWCYRFGMESKLYKVTLDKKEHRPRLYKNRLFGKIIYPLFGIVGAAFSKLGNEALIILEKTNIIRYSGKE